jgi:hypothetical protein
MNIISLCLRIIFLLQFKFHSGDKIKSIVIYLRDARYFYLVQATDFYVCENKNIAAAAKVFYRCASGIGSDIHPFSFFLYVLTRKRSWIYFYF